jgi:hypothetical protein
VCGADLQRGTWFVQEFNLCANRLRLRLGECESTSDDTIDYATIDNSQYAYWVILDVPASLAVVNQQIWACDMVIEYSYRNYLPGVIKNH